MIKVLVTGGGGAGNEALWRLLRDRYDIHFADADIRNVDPAIPAERKHAVPWAISPGFVARVGELCRNLDIQVLVPSVDEELPLLSRAASLLAPTRLMLPSSEYIGIMSDKYAMAETLAKRGISVPATRLMADGPGKLTFPLVAKPRRGRGSRDVSIMRDPASVKDLIARVNGEAHGMVLQEWIGGVEYTVQMLADSQARLHAIAPVRVHQKRGITVHGETDPNPAVVAACKAIHEAAPAAGCYNIQLKLPPDGRALPFEINPRISTTCCLVVAAGLDPISIFLRPHAPAEITLCRPAVRLHRFWMNHFTYGDLS